MELITILTLALSNMKNAEHVQYHTNVCDILKKVTAEKIGLNVLVLNNYATAIETEQDIVNMASGSSYTEQMKEMDQLRDIIYKRVHRKLELCEYEHQNSDAYKARNIVKKQILSKYPTTVADLPYQEETATISGFVQDCRSALSMEQLESIRIDADLDDLLAVNKNFSEKYQSRVDEKAAIDLQLSQKLRAATDQVYSLLLMNLGALANDPDPEKEEKVQTARETIQKINVLIRDAKTRMEQRRNGLSESASDSGSENGTTEKPSDSKPSDTNSDKPGNSGGSIVVPNNPDDVFE